MSRKDSKLVYSTEPDPEPEESMPAQESPRNPAAPFAIQGNQPVIVGLERKGRKGKSVTVIKGVLSPQTGKRALLKHLKQAAGSGGALKGDILEVQGDLRDRVVELLEELGYRARRSGG